MNFAGKRVAVIGLGRSNLPLIRVLLRKGAQVTGCDKKRAEEFGDKLAELAASGVDTRLGPGYLDDLCGFDYIFLTPGMRKDFPAIAAARQAGTVILSEMRLFFQLCPVPILGVTGSSGKTTTTTLIGQMMEAAGDHPVFVGGNIGQPLIEHAEEIPADARVVLELSSFQLEDLTRSPHISVITNITPNHLDQHASMEEYVAAKKNIFLAQQAGDTVVLNWDDPTTRAMGDEAPGRVAFFSRRDRLPQGAFVADGEIRLKWDGSEVRVCRAEELKLLGQHNIENVLAAAMAAYLFGATPELIRRVATTFTGVPHRLELVREHRGVSYYNDSIATSPARAIAGLSAFDRPIVLIAGGYDKKLPFDEFARVLIGKTRGLVVLGVTAPLIKMAVREAAQATGTAAPPIVEASSFDEAVAEASRLADPGDVVLLSPACASYDMFRNFEERGQRFRELVQALK